jgi:uncharacterized membrane protein YczE
MTTQTSPRASASNGAAKAAATRVALVLGGAFVSTLCYAMTIRAHLGLGPLFVVQDGLAKTTGQSIGTCVMIVGVVLVLLGWVVRAMPGLGTIALPFVTGPMLDRVLPHMGDIHGMVWRVLAVAVGSWFMCFGGSLVIRAALGASAIDEIMLGLSERSGRTVRQVRLAMEATMFFVGLVLGGAVGVGTVMTAVLVGPALHFWLTRSARATTPSWQRASAAAAS